MPETFYNYAKRHTPKECKLIADAICFTLHNPAEAQALMLYLRKMLDSAKPRYSVPCAKGTRRV